MYRQELLHGFDLYYQRLFDDEVDAVCRLDTEPLVVDGNFVLPLESQTLQLELVREAHLVSRFEQPRADLAVNGETSPDHPLRQVPMSSAQIHSHASAKPPKQFPPISI